jgi:opacity protein-like surface antigen
MNGSCKKAIFGAAVMLALAGAASVSALDLSAGVGAVLVNNFSGGFSQKESHTFPWVGVGVNAFFDAQYVEANVGLVFCGGHEQSISEGFTNDEYDKSYSFTGLNIGALGKYPVALSDNMTLFPTAGLEYALILAGEETAGAWDGNNGRSGASDHNTLWFKFGAGLDYAINDKLFLRPEILYGIGLPGKYQKDIVDEAKKSAELSGSDVNISPNINHGFTVKVGVGYRL